MKERTATTITYIVLIVVTVVAIAPFWVMFVMSTYSTQEISKAVTLIPGSYLIKNMQTILGGGFGIYYWNSAYTSVVVMAASVLVSAMAGYGFAKFQFKGNKLIHTLVVASMMIPYQLGLIGYVVEMRVLKLSNTHLPIILANIATCFGVFWMTQNIKSGVPDAIIESARLDGCGEIRIFFQIIMPYIKPGLATLMILQFMWSWNSYLLPLVCLANPDLFTLPLGIASLGTRYQMDYAAQICALSIGTIPMIVVFLFGSKYFIKGLTAGALKG